MTRGLKRMMSAAVVALAVPAVVLVGNATAHAASWEPSGGKDCTDGDDGGCSAWSTLWTEGNAHLGASFRAHGEHLSLDDYATGRTPVAVLWVEGNGTAVYVGEQDENLSFDEGLEFTITVHADSADGSSGETWSGIT